ncbi:MAG: hypothetical protein U1E63_16345 [Burkholderiales bacterium]
MAWRLDKSVNPANAEETVKQWANAYFVAHTIDMPVDGHRRRVWQDAQGQDLDRGVVHDCGMAHGAAVDPGSAAHQCGTAAPFNAAGISSSYRIASFWGLVGERLDTAVAGDAPQEAGTTRQADDPAHTGAGEQRSRRPWAQERAQPVGAASTSMGWSRSRSKWRDCCEDGRRDRRVRAGKARRRWGSMQHHRHFAGGGRLAQERQPQRNAHQQRRTVRHRRAAHHRDRASRRPECSTLPAQACPLRQAVREALPDPAGKAKAGNCCTTRRGLPRRS